MIYLNQAAARYLVFDINHDARPSFIDAKPAAVIIDEIGIVVLDHLLLDEGIENSFAHRGIVIAVARASRPEIYLEKYSDAPFKPNR